MTEASMEQATLGGGCFWCLEAVFLRLAGVESVEPGYAGGHLARPSYQQVCAGRTGHAEVVRLRFDPGILPFRELLEVFFAIHDPTTPDRQGADVGPQYRSIILAHSAAQRAEAERLIADLERERVWDAPIVTEVVDAGTFWPAEPEHHRYYDRNPEQGYCRVVIAPKVAKLRSRFAQRLRE
jgi:peptide-methionine (S)-S-oxide reductase